VKQYFTTNFSVCFTCRPARGLSRPHCLLYPNCGKILWICGLTSPPSAGSAGWRRCRGRPSRCGASPPGTGTASSCPRTRGGPGTPRQRCRTGGLLLSVGLCFFEWARLRLEQWVGYCCVKCVSCVLFSQIFIYSKSYTVFAP